MELIDTHCHLDVSEFDADRPAVLERARRAGVTAQVVPAIDAAGMAGLLRLCAGEADLFPALGLHPIYLEHHRPEHLSRLERTIADHHPLAVGEIGLDYYLRELDRAAQQRLFEAQLTIARDAGLPVLLHIRKAYDEVGATLRRLRFLHGGIAHAFSGSLEQARRLLDLGFKLGFGGTVTYPGSSRIRRLARELPLEALVLETDAPDIPTAAHRGMRNGPEYLPEILAALAEVRDQPAEEVAAATTATARALLRLPVAD
ncbi:TatD family hydrolase [Endothiovibrio diazotrophicus]